MSRIFQLNTKGTLGLKSDCQCRPIVGYKGIHLSCNTQRERGRERGRGEGEGGREGGREGEGKGERESPSTLYCTYIHVGWYR